MKGEEALPRQRLENLRYVRWAQAQGPKARKFMGLDLRAMPLSGFDLKGADLREADLSGAILAHARLTKADLTGANLRNADLSWANLTKAELIGADFSGANLAHTKFTKANLPGANFTGADLSYADFVEAELTDADFSNANVYQADFTDSVDQNYPDVDFDSFEVLDSTDPVVEEPDVSSPVVAEMDANGRNLSRAPVTDLHPTRLPTDASLTRNRAPATFSISRRSPLQRGDYDSYLDSLSEDLPAGRTTWLPSLDDYEEAPE